MIGPEQAEVAPEAVAVARIAVEELSATEIVIPASSSEALPPPSGAPVQSALE